ncbi:transcriptional regulator, LacI family [Actinomyces denticolens]|uniref:Transcriptional regulator, LacI family n=1 Tax=Actinomyces denticolens TaxID=52767 RepID=A0ABY1I1F8_9ACTO|nr:LacI family DNA-binding transcriptional regulator [Actinomyces denticolens]SHI44854.1 transcriptional regulator, LacI family [Actinomyces denticolens]
MAIADGAPRGHATQSDVARAAGVSRGLVSLALKGGGRMSERTRERILQAARDLDYQPNGAAAQLAARRSSRLVIVLPYLDNPFFDILVRHVRREAAQVGHSLVVLVSDLEARLEESTIADALRMRPAGLILPGTRMGAEALERLGGRLPVCLLDRALPGHVVATPHMDETSAADQVMEHLAGLGTRHIAYLTPARILHERLVDDRGLACRAAAQARGMSFSSAACEDGALPALDTALTGAAGPAAIVAYNDLLAIDVAAALYQRGARLPLASYDNTPLAARPEFSLTSVDQDPAALARAAVGMLTGVGPAPGVATIAPSLVIRASTVPTVPTVPAVRAESA